MQGFFYVGTNLMMNANKKLNRKITLTPKNNEWVLTHVRNPHSLTHKRTELIFFAIAKKKYVLKAWTNHCISTTIISIKKATIANG
jgi:hypothetical protein